MSPPADERARGVNPRLLVALGLAMVLLALGVMLVRVTLSVRDVQARLGAVEQLSQQSGTLDLTQIRGDLAAVKSDLAQIRSDAGWLLPLAPLFGWLPQFGPDIAQTPALFDMADALVSAADIAFDAWSPLLDLLEGRKSESSAPFTERLIEPLLANRTRFVQARGYLTAAEAARARIDLNTLSPRMAALVKRVDRIQPLLTLATDGGLAMPELLGANGPRTYLVVAQNEDELRATGGFISAAGRLTLDRGKIVELEFTDSYQVDDLNADFPQPPEPLQTYMLAGYWLFRDANWSPDFPSAARQMANLYTLGQRKHVDGVIALDQAFVRALVQAMGTLELEGSPPITVTPDNLSAYMRASWTNAPGSTTGEWFNARKNFIGTLSKALQARVMGGGQVNWLELGRALHASLREKHLLVYVSDPALAPTLTRLGWDGALQTPAGDYLMVVDSNVGFSKANALLRQSFTHTVSIAPDFSARATLAIRYALEGRGGAEPCRQRVPDYALGVTYDAMMRTCLWDYLRVYAPGESVLHDATRFPLPSARLLNSKAPTGEPQSLAGEADKRVFTNFFVVEPGSERLVRFDYALPRGVVRAVGADLWAYRLTWQKQPGTARIPVDLTVTLPTGAEMVRAETSNNAAAQTEKRADGSQVHLQFELTTDVTVEIVFRRSS